MKEIKDKSQKAEEIRKIIREKKPPEKKVTRYIRYAFSLSYKEKGFRDNQRGLALCRPLWLFMILELTYIAIPLLILADWPFILLNC
ncbi:MAG: hypothetical protein ACOCVD_02575 [Bacillota bacterium]